MPPTPPHNSIAQVALLGPSQVGKSMFVSAFQHELRTQGWVVSSAGGNAADNAQVSDHLNRLEATVLGGQFHRPTEITASPLGLPFRVSRDDKPPIVFRIAKSDVVPT